MTWLTWNKESNEIVETDGQREVVLNYAETAREAREYAKEQGMTIVIS